jgi:membrane protein DedA with SNARE-associated domain
MLLFSGLGIPIPEDVPLLAAGVLSHHGGLSVPIASVLCSLFVLGRDLIVYGLGRRYGDALLDRPLGRRLVSKRVAARARTAIEKHGSAVVFVGRFLPGLRAGVFFVAGASGVTAPRFVVADIAAAAISVPVFVWAGAKFAENLDGIAEFLREFRIGLFALSICVIVFVWVRHRRPTARGEA